MQLEMRSGLDLFLSLTKMNVDPSYFAPLGNYKPVKPAKKASKKAKPSGTKRVGVKSNEAIKRSRNARAATRKLPQGAKWVRKVPRTKGLDKALAEATQVEVMNIPMFLIDAHACLCAPSKDKCFGRPYESVFTLPKDTFLLSFAQSGEGACTTPGTVWSMEDNMRKYLYTHSEGDIGGNDRVGRSRFSFFSGIRRAVGGTNPTNGYTTEIPNINFTMNESDKNPDGSIKKGANGKTVLIPRASNPYGVYDANDPTIVDADGYYRPNNTMSLLPQDPDREDWTLKDIIEEVYRIRKIRSAIFVSLGCLSPCGKAVTSDDLTEAGILFDRANAEYVNLRETFTESEMRSLGIEQPYNLGLVKQQAYPNASEVLAGIKAGLHNRELLEVPRAYHYENRNEIARALRASKAIRERFVSGASGK
jgi:hypothetical protein